jgi:hypothetical protein
MESTFHNAYITRGLVHSTVTFWKELSCWDKSYSNYTTLFLGWRHWYTYSTVIITNWLTDTTYPYLKWHWIFSLLRRFCSSYLYHRQDFWSDLTMWVTRWTSYKKQELFTLYEHLVTSLVFLGGSVELFTLCEHLVTSLVFLVGSVELFTLCEHLVTSLVFLVGSVELFTLCEHLVTSLVFLVGYVLLTLCEHLVTSLVFLVGSVLLTLCEHLVTSLVFLVGSVLLILSFLLLLLFCLSSFCILCPMLPLSLVFPFLITPSGFPNVYDSNR